jgi:hypothetical protein
MKVIFFLLAVLTLSACASAGNRDEREVFIVDLRSPHVELAEIEAMFDGFMSIGRLRPTNVKVLYFPRENAVCLQYRREFITYHLFWSPGGRQAFITALEKYNEDFDAENLSRRGIRTRRNYGIVDGYLIWQGLSFTVQGRAGVRVELGYEFKDRSPYFSVNQREAVHKVDTSGENDITSQGVIMYFSRAQAARLAELFNPAYLRDITAENTVNRVN